MKRWLLQRVSALILLLALAGLGWLALVSAPLDEMHWRQLFAGTPARVLAALAGFALAVHAWCGFEDVVGDYVRAAIARRLLLAAGALWLLAGLARLAFVLR